MPNVTSDLLERLVARLGEDDPLSGEIRAAIRTSNGAGAADLRIPAGLAPFAADALRVGSVKAMMSGRPEGVVRGMLSLQREVEAVIPAALAELGEDTVERVYELAAEGVVGVRVLPESWREDGFELQFFTDEVAFRPFPKRVMSLAEANRRMIDIAEHVSVISQELKGGEPQAPEGEASP